MFYLDLAMRFCRRTLLREPVELALRAASWVDPRVHDKAKRIRRVQEGQPRSKSEHWLVFVYNAPGAVPSFFRSLFEASARQGVNIAVVTNSCLPGVTRRYILENAQLFIERENVGRDFGAYKDAIEILFARNERIDQLILANDSVYYLPEEADNLVVRALACRGFGAITESRQTRHHAQSFFLVFTPRVHGSDAFKRFWKNYRPIHTRYYAIRKGEFGLTQALTKAGFDVEPFCKVEQLGKCLQILSVTSLKEMISWMPLGNRWAVNNRIAKGSPVFDAIMSEVVKRNPAHVAAFLFMGTTGFPVVKRNLYAKEKYAAGELELILDAMRTESRFEILRDLSRGQSQARSPNRPLMRFLHREGLR